MSEVKPVSFALVSDAFVRLRYKSQLQCVEQMFDWVLQRFPEIDQHTVGMMEQLASEEPDRVAALRSIADVVKHLPEQTDDIRQEVLEAMHKIVCEYVHPEAMETPLVQTFTTLPYHCQTELFRDVLVSNLRPGATTKAIETGEWIMTGHLRADRKVVFTTIASGVYSVTDAATLIDKIRQAWGCPPFNLLVPEHYGLPKETL